MLLLIMGAGFAAIGAGVIVAVVTGAVPGALLLMAIIFVAVGILLLGIGGASVGGRRRIAHLLAEGVDGTARVDTVAQTNTTINNQPVIKLGLTVTVEGRPPYPVTLRKAVPLIYLVRLAPGGTLAVKVDPARPEQLAIDWNGAPVSEPRLGGGHVARPPAVGLPADIALPRLPQDAAGQSVERLREQVRAFGAPGRAIVDSVQVSDAPGEGGGYLLGMWVQLDSGPAYRMENAPVRVDPEYAARVRPGVMVPVRVAQVRSGLTMAVLEWEKL